MKLLGRAGWITLLAGSFVSALVGLLVQTGLQRGAEVAFRAQAAETFRAVQSQMISANNVLDTLRRFLDLDETTPTRAAFQEFARRTRSRTLALRDSGFAPRVTEAQRGPFEAAARQDGAPGFLIREPGPAGGAMVPATSRADHYPIFFPDPVEMAPAVIGLDLTFEQGRRDAIARAIATNRPVATPPLAIVTAKGATSGFMSFLPVFGPGGTGAPPLGVVYGVFEIAPMLHHILADELRSADLDVLFFDPALHDRTIFFGPAPTRASDLPPPTATDMRASVHWEGRLDMAGQPWGVIFVPSRGLGGWGSWPTVLGVLSGLLLTALLVAYIEASGRRSARLVALTTKLRATTRSLVEKSQRLSYLAGHDPLTALSNRTTFVERLDAVLQGPDGRCLAVVSVDLDGFKAVNDTHGHPVGDALLVAVAQRLTAALDGAGQIARFGGDEFALMLPFSDQATVEAICRRILQRLCEPFEVRGAVVCVGASLGVALAGADGETSEDLLTNADAALYRAKADGRSTVRFFAADMDLRLRDRQRLMQDLRTALARGELAVHYQPFVDARSGSVTGCEALVRWMHPTRGLVSPAIFIPLAEQTGLIGPIGAWVMRQACEDAARWPGTVRLSVNLSAVQFGEEDLPGMIADALHRSGLPAARLEVEVTETVLIEDPEKALAVLNHIRALGVGIALDDFGTGYSSLSYLCRFRFDKVKIDQSFVRDLSSHDNQVLIGAIQSIAVGLDMSMTAEGVETEDQARRLRRVGCDELQGYLFSRPVPAVRLDFEGATSQPDLGHQAAWQGA